MEIAFTRHALERMGQRGVTEPMIREAINSPDVLAPAKGLARWRVHKRLGQGNLRVIYEEAHGVRRVVTVYWAEG